MEREGCGDHTRVCELIIYGHVFDTILSKGKLIEDVFEQYKSVGATLNVLPFCSQFIPMEVITAAAEGSIIYHPSILPRHRGASAINW